MKGRVHDAFMKKLPIFFIALSLISTTAISCDDGDSKSDNEQAPLCGNGTVEDGEQCDDANTTDGDGCSSTCMKELIVSTTCGDGKLDTEETCDDANTTDGDGCSSTCMKETGYFPTPNPGPVTTCNDKKHEAGEVCDPYFIGYVLDKETRTCKVENGKCVLSTSTTASNCGTGTLEDGEECDDGNTVNGDGCSNKCKKESTCIIQNGSRAQVLLVVDGDTLRLKIINDGKCQVSKTVPIRLHGIDSPECLKTDTKSPVDSNYSAYSCDAAQSENFADLDHNEPMGYAAQQAMNALIFNEENQNGIVEIECETRSDTDATCLTDATNSRYLAYLKIKKGGKYVDAAEELVRLGYAFSYTDFTSQRQATYCAAELEARDAKAGFWSLAASFQDAVSKLNSDKQRWLTSQTHSAICGE